MRINYLTFSKPIKLCILQGLAFGFTLFVASKAQANGYDECSQILTQDIFNKVIKSESINSTFAAEVIATFFQQNETQAYEAYSMAFDEAKKRRTKIDVEGHYGIIGGQLGIDLTSENKVSQAEFSQKFSKAKSTYQSSTSSKSSSSQNLMNHYATYMRDPVTVNAWKDCITRTRETDLYAFASRDQAGRIFVNVMWVPGALGGTVPTILIGFVTDSEEEGIKIYANPEEQIAIGSGRHFAVSCGKKCDNGFQITVNGTLKNSTGTPTSSFTTTVEVPPLKPPEPLECSWEGEWYTEWIANDDKKYSSNITFVRKDEGLYGTYIHGYLLLKGQGRVVAGNWYNTSIQSLKKNLPKNAGLSNLSARAKESSLNVAPQFHYLLSQNRRPPESGTVKFVKNGCSFEGSWNYRSEAPKYWWRGIKLE